MRVNLTRMRD